MGHYFMDTQYNEVHTLKLAGPEQDNPITG